MLAGPHTPQALSHIPQPSLTAGYCSGHCTDTKHCVPARYHDLDALLPLSPPVSAHRVWLTASFSFAVAPKARVSSYDTSSSAWPCFARCHPTVSWVSGAVGRTPNLPYIVSWPRCWTPLHSLSSSRQLGAKTHAHGRRTPTSVGRTWRGPGNPAPRLPFFFFFTFSRTFFSFQVVFLKNHFFLIFSCSHNMVHTWVCRLREGVMAPGDPLPWDILQALALVDALAAEGNQFWQASPTHRA